MTAELAFLGNKTSRVTAKYMNQLGLRSNKKTQQIQA
jgi:hypothetical protein